MKVSFALVLTAFVGSAVGAVIPRGDGPGNDVGGFFGGDDGFGRGGWFKGSKEQSSEKDRSASQKGEQKQHQGEDLRKDQSKTDEYKTHDGTDDIWDQEHVKGTKQTTGKETDESVNKDHSDEDKKAFTTYWAPAGYKGDGNGNQKRGDGDGNSDGNGKGASNGGDHIKETGTEDHIIKDHQDANRKQLDWTTNEAFEGDRDRKEHKVDHDTDRKQTQAQSEQAHREKDNSNKFDNSQNAVDKQSSKDTFEGSGNGFGNFDNFGDNFKGWKRAL